MPRIELIAPDTATASARDLLATIRGAAGGVTNLFKATAHSPAALKGLWGMYASLAGGVLPAPLRERIALAVSDRNRCGYCVSAHSFMGRKAGLSPEELSAAQAGESADPKAAAALRFALTLVDSRGVLADHDVQALRDAGFSDEELVEVLAHVALNVFTNYLTIALQVPTDFPAVPLRGAS